MEYPLAPRNSWQSKPFQPIIGLSWRSCDMTYTMKLERLHHLSNSLFLQKDIFQLHHYKFDSFYWRLSVHRTSKTGATWWTFTLWLCIYHRTSTERERRERIWKCSMMMVASSDIYTHSISAGCQFCHVIIWGHW